MSEDIMTVEPLGEDTKPPCCQKCGERLKTSVILVDLCGLCDDDVRNGR